MSPEQHDFEALRRLLALKRHEQPPPGYFHYFSREVIARIRAGERPGPSTFWERFLGESPWLQGFWDAIEGKPIFAAAFGVAVCGLLVTGISVAEPSDKGVMAGILAVEPVVDHVVSERRATVFESPVLRVSGNPSSMAGVISLRAGRPLLESMGRPRFQPLIYNVPAGN